MINDITRPHITQLLSTAQSILVKKAHDYASDNDKHSNFKYSELLSDPFPTPYKSYAVLIATKFARISQLLQKGKTANESIEDSFVDCVNYVALMYERYKEENK